jgi:hypothetical protein
MPQQYQVIVDAVLDRLPEDMAKPLTWVEVAHIFGLDVRRAEESRSRTPQSKSRSLASPYSDERA